MLSYRETPVLEVEHHVVRDAGLRLLIKREDLNHPEVSGNKWWKLKYNLEEAFKSQHKTILTFGGAYSNHIYATAAAASLLRLKSIGVIRGESTVMRSPTLQFATARGMTVHYITREQYRLKDSLAFIKDLHNMFGDFYLIPEGGTNEQALRGCQEFGVLLDDIPADYVCLPVGTGGTFGGLLRTIDPSKTVLGFSVLKNGEFLREKIEHFSQTSVGSWKLITDYSYGGYAKRDERVRSFIISFREQVGVPLDFIYTGKMMCAIFDLIDKGFFAKGSTILAVHTGGIQGHSE